MHQNRLEPTGGSDPNSIQRQRRSEGRKSGKSGGVSENGLDGPKRTAPQPPFVEIPHEHTVRSHTWKQPLDLKAALRRTQTQMRGNDLHSDSAACHIQVDRTSWLVGRDTEVQQPNVST